MSNAILVYITYGVLALLVLTAMFFFFKVFTSGSKVKEVKTEQFADNTSNNKFKFYKATNKKEERIVVDRVKVSKESQNRNLLENSEPIPAQDANLGSDSGRTSSFFNFDEQDFKLP